MDKDLSNIYIANEFNTKIILVADIEKGGVFASIWGVYNLLPSKLRDNVIGVVINKFRGDLSLFDRGVEIIEEEFKIPVLGVLPYTPFNLGFEDSQSLINYAQKSKKGAKRIGVIAYPTMSNYNDFEPLIADDNISLEFIKSNINLESFDLIILAGSKLVVRDLEWLKEVGLFRRLKKSRVDILGICGGYEMMFNRLIDREHIEGDKKIVDGLGFINDDIIFQKEKIVKRGVYNIFGEVINGFEIHHGVSRRYPIYYERDNIRGTFVHGIFNSKKFIEYKKRTIDTFISNIESRLNIQKIIEKII